jgi:pimeloyl-ACP methyl ester carboxylesterase
MPFEKSKRLVFKESEMKKRTILIIVGLLLAVGLFYGGRSVYYEFYPVPIEPSAEWEPFVSALDAKREAFFVENDGIKIEAELFIPNGGEEQKPAVVFSPGSGDSLYQNYAPGLVETYILDLFLSRDMAVLLINKRGMGQSEGLYTASSIEGRAEDVNAAVRTIQTHPNIDADHIGLVGHSEGGWVVAYAAAQNPEIAFFIGLAGPTVTRKEQSQQYYSYEAICAGLEGEEYDRYLEKRINTTDLGIKIGKVTNFGSLGFDYRSMSFDPRASLQAVESPGLYILGENDILVIPDLNIERMEEIFDGEVPENLSIAVAEGATHGFRVVSAPCDSLNDPAQYELSTEVVTILNDWLTELGY